MQRVGIVKYLMPLQWAELKCSSTMMWDQQDNKFVVVKESKGVGQLNLVLSGQWTVSQKQLTKQDKVKKAE